MRMSWTAKYSPHPLDLIPPSEEIGPLGQKVGIPVMRYDRAARPCALNFRLAALKCSFGCPPNALSSVGV